MKTKIFIGLSSIAILAVLFVNIQVFTSGSTSFLSISSVQKALGDLGDEEDCIYCGGDGIYAGSTCPYCSD